MRLKRITALFLAVLTCIFTLTAGVSAAEKKGIKLDKTKVTVAVGETCTLKPSLVGYKKATVQWSSSDKSVATVKKGVVTAKKEGTAKITVKIKDTKYKATCTVTVTKKSSGNAGNSTGNNKGSNDYKDANAFVSKIKVGWNLGNALDATGGSGVSSETSWGNVKTTKELITAVKKAGFNTVRIPVSWGKHIDSSGNIDEAWLDRVQEVVDYAYDNNMYVILNVHHDNSTFPLDEKTEAAVTKKYKNLWKQIAARFKDYDEKLIFEGRNEPSTEGSPKQWTGGTKEEWGVINRMYKVFVDTVRESGGNNKTRFLMIAPYGATNLSYQAMTALEIPDDRTIVEVHAYNPYNLALDGNMSYTDFDEKAQNELDWVFDNINKAYTSKGIPVILDECGYTNKGKQDERIKAYTYMITKAKSYGIPCVIWDNGGTGTGGEKLGFINRTTYEWYYPELVKAIVDASK